MICFLLFMVGGGYNDFGSGYGQQSSGGPMRSGGGGGGGGYSGRNAPYSGKLSLKTE